MATVTVSYSESSYLFKRRVIVLEEEFPFRIGRCHTGEKVSSNNALFASKNPSLSHNHAFFVLMESKVYIEDNSINGTFVNGKKIVMSKLHEIHTGDTVQLAQDLRYKGHDFQAVRLKVVISSEGDRNNKNLIDAKYPHLLHFYLNPPTSEVELSSIVESTEKRFEVLKVFEKFGEIEMSKCNEISVILNELRDKFEDFYKFITRSFDSLENEFNWLEKDNMSHHILRIGFSRNFHLHYWFIKQECKLMFTRWHFLNDLERVDFLDSCQIPYEWVGTNERENLDKKYPNFLEAKIDLIKIHFSEVINLLNRRDYLLINGYIYVPLNAMLMAVVYKFELLLENKLKEINKNLHRIADEKRIYSVINYVEKQFSSSDLQPTRRIVRSDMIDELSEKSFPLCMNILNYYLNKWHHLRNGGRFQYGLFLKCIGVPLFESLKFWKNHFVKIMEEDQFNRNYSYHIRHIYGTVGKKFSYPPEECNKILKDNPGPLEYHGCPFRTLNYDRIMFELRRNNINDEDCEDIWNLMNNGLPQVACTRYFNVIHKSSVDLITHPNLYFERSQYLRNEVVCMGSDVNEVNLSLCKGCAPEW